MEAVMVILASLIVLILRCAFFFGLGYLIGHLVDVYILTEPIVLAEGLTFPSLMGIIFVVLSIFFARG